MQMPMLNPALSGLWVNEFAAGLSWTGGVLRIPMAPFVRIDGFNPILHSGFGISATGTAANLEDDPIVVRGNYNYQIRFKDSGRLSFGLMLSYATLNQTQESTAGFGFAYATPTWHFGLAAQNVIVLFDEPQNQIQRPMFLATGHYLFKISEALSFKPEGLLGQAENEELFYNIGAKASYTFAYLGVYYLRDDGLFEGIDKRWAYSAGINLFRFLNLDYAISTSGITDLRHTITFRLYAPN